MRRASLRGIDFGGLLQNQARFSVSYRFLGDHQLLTGRVNKIVRYPDGDFVMVSPEPGSGLENWEEVPLWISSLNQSGVLAIWTTNTTPAREAA